MQILFAISILCFLALVWALIAVSRHIRSGRDTASSPAPETFAQHIAHASASPESNQPKLRHTLNQSIRDITARKSWNQPPEVITMHPSLEQRAEWEKETIQPLAGIRKAPQSSRSGGTERLDWAYFNKDFGDLTDPYQSPRIQANSRNSSRR